MGKTPTKKNEEKRKITEIDESDAIRQITVCHTALRAAARQLNKVRVSCPGFKAVLIARFPKTAQVTKDEKFPTHYAWSNIRSDKLTTTNETENGKLQQSSSSSSSFKAKDDDFSNDSNNNPLLFVAESMEIIANEKCNKFEYGNFAEQELDEDLGDPNNIPRAYDTGPFLSRRTMPTNPPSTTTPPPAASSSSSSTLTVQMQTTLSEKGKNKKRKRNSEEDKRENTGVNESTDRINLMDLPMPEYYDNNTLISPSKEQDGDFFIVEPSTVINGNEKYSSSPYLNGAIKDIPKSKKHKQQTPTKRDEILLEKLIKGRHQTPLSNFEPVSGGDIDELSSIRINIANSDLRVDNNNNNNNKERVIDEDEQRESEIKSPKKKENGKNIKREKSKNSNYISCQGIKRHPRPFRPPLFKKSDVQNFVDEWPEYGKILGKNLSSAETTKKSIQTNVNSTTIINNNNSNNDDNNKTIKLTVNSLPKRRIEDDYSNIFKSGLPLNLSSSEEPDDAIHFPKKKGRKPLHQTILKRQKLAEKMEKERRDVSNNNKNSSDNSSGLDEENIPFQNIAMVTETSTVTTTTVQTTTMLTSVFNEEEVSEKSLNLPSSIPIEKSHENGILQQANSVIEEMERRLFKTPFRINRSSLDSTGMVSKSSFSSSDYNNKNHYFTSISPSFEKIGRNRNGNNNNNNDYVLSDEFDQSMILSTPLRLASLAD